MLGWRLETSTGQLGVFIYQVEHVDGDMWASYSGYITKYKFGYY